MNATTDGPGGDVLAWTTDRPSEPGAYRIRGFAIGRPKEEAVVEVIKHGSKLRCNLHMCNSDHDLGEWSHIESFNAKFEWQRLDTITALLADKARLTSENARLRADAALGAAIQRAAGELPERAVITVEIERGYGGFVLTGDDHGPLNEEHFNGDTLADKLNSAIDAALHPTAPSEVQS